MKKLIGGILCSAAIVLTSASTAMAAGKVLNESEQSSIKQYFTDILNERTPSAPIPTKISVNSKNYNELRNELWSIWSQANKEFDEPQLVEPMNLKAEGYDRVSGDILNLELNSLIFIIPSFFFYSIL